MLKKLYDILREKVPMLFLDYYDSDSEEDDDDDDGDDGDDEEDEWEGLM